MMHKIFLLFRDTGQSLQASSERQQHLLLSPEFTHDCFLLIGMMLLGEQVTLSQFPSFCGTKDSTHGLSTKHCP